MKSRHPRSILALAFAVLLSSCQIGSIGVASNVSFSSSEFSSEEAISSQSVSLETNTQGQPTQTATQSASTQTSSSSSSASMAYDSTNMYFALPESDSRWPLSFKEYGTNFRNRLAKLIEASGSRTIAYDSIGSVLRYSDASPSTSGVVPFYHDSSHHLSHYTREHVWPNSRGAGESGPGADPQMIRPADADDNSSRSNFFYGDALLDTAGSTWDPASLGYEAARGECARIIFYTATRYWNTCGTGGNSYGTSALSLSNNPTDSTSAHTMGRLDRLIQWNNQYPVTSMEIQRNNYLDDAGFARNPFIDHPEYANWIWSTKGLRTSAVNTDPIGQEDIPSLDYDYNFRRVTSEAAALSSNVAIVGKMTSDTTYFAMSNAPKNANYPHYIGCEEMIYHDSIFSIDGHDVRYFTIDKLENGHYTIHSGSKYLYNYISTNDNGTTYYSVAFDSDAEGASNEWIITFNGNGNVVIRGASNNVYLEYWQNASGNKDFQGYRYAPRESLVLVQ